MKWLDLYSKTVMYKGESADLVSFVDITERKRAEEALRRSLSLRPKSGSARNNLANVLILTGRHEEALRELEKAMPADVMVSTDIGNINSVANSYLRFERPRSFLAPMSFGNCGYALPTIIGAKAAAPERPAVSYAGDGAWGMSMSELMTAVRHDIPVTAVVFHNRQWGAEKKNQVDFYNRRFVAGELDNESFVGIAKAMGAEGIVVDKLEDVGPALKRAIDLQMTQKKTCVIEIMCTRELGDPFRRDALSKPVRFLDKYRDYV